VAEPEAGVQGGKAASTTGAKSAGTRGAKKAKAVSVDDAFGEEAGGF
jgi:recombination protein RecA